MQRQEGPQTPFEVYCYNCHVTFAAGTRRCVHCGGRLGGFRGPGPAGFRGSGPAPDATEPPAELAEPDPSEPSIGRRLGGMSLWVLLALGAAVLRMCQGG